MIDAKQRFSEALLTLCSKYSLEKISVTDLVKETGSSRQTFYNHFQDKNDLIQYVYESRCLYVWEKEDCYENYMKYCIEYFRNLKSLQHFLIQACKMKGQNNLSDFIVSYANKWEQKWFLKYHPSGDYPPEYQFQIDYHCYGMMHLVISWVLSGMTVSPEKMAALVTRFRNASLAELLISE